MPCTSAIVARVDLDRRPSARRRRGPALSTRAAARNRLEVRLASRTGAPGRQRGVGLLSRRHRRQRAARDQTRRAHALHASDPAPHRRDQACSPVTLRWRASSRDRARAASPTVHRHAGAGEVAHGLEVGRRRLALGQHHGGLEPPRARRRRPSPRTTSSAESCSDGEVDAGGGVGAAVEVAHAPRPRRRRRGPGSLGPGSPACCPRRRGRRHDGHAVLSPSASSRVGLAARTTGAISTVPILLRRPVAALGLEAAARGTRRWSRGSGPCRGAWPSARRRCRRRRPRRRRRPARRGRRPGSARTPGSRRPSRCSTSTSSASYSSVISPTISSSMSSIVTSPAVPPYSSTTTAMCWRSACISASRASTGLESGT